MLTRVTITGADDMVDPGELAKLSEQFPHVEWGILFSSSRVGTPRYPTVDWVRRLHAETRLEDMKLSAHLCGQHARDTLKGSDWWLRSVAGLDFGRVQLTGSVVPEPPFFVHTANYFPAVEFILQAHSEAEVPEAAAIAARLHRGSVLFDPSGGRGIEAFRWPAPPLGLRLGYAGGIKPSNVLQVLKDIGPVDAPFWLDMESGVRTDDKFDLGLVREVLTLTAPFVTGEQR